MVYSIKREKRKKIPNVPMYKIFMNEIYIVIGLVPLAPPGGRCKLNRATRLGTTAPSGYYLIITVSMRLNGYQLRGLY